MQNTDQIPENKFRLRDIFNLITLIGLLFLMIGIVLTVIVPPLITPKKVLDMKTVQATLVSVEPYTEKVPERRYDREGTERTVWVTKTSYWAAYEYTLDGSVRSWVTSVSASDPPQTRTVTLYKTKDGWSDSRPPGEGDKLTLILVFAGVTLLGAGFTALGIWIGLPSKQNSSNSKSTPKGGQHDETNLSL